MEPVCEEKFNSLREMLDGELWTNAPYRAMYSTDASPYRVVPKAVACPASVKDVEIILKWAEEQKIPIHGRGTGSGLTGACVGSGIVVDFRRHMDSILELNISEQTVTVEPGIVLSALNRELAEKGFFFPPDPASGDYCTIGGMISNNSSGARSVKYGATIDYISSLEAVIPGTGLIFAKDYHPPFNDDSGRTIPFLTELNKVLNGKMKLFKDALPNAPKNCCGYRLERVLTDDGTIHLAPLFCGSEGTLGLITRATLKILPLPEERRVTLLNFSSLDAMTKAVELILPSKPSAVEVMDHVFLKLVISNHPNLKPYVPDGTKAQLLVETDGSIKEAESKAQEIKQLFASHNDLNNGLLSIIEAKSKEEQEQLWKVRKSALPILFTLKGPGEITPFIEDISVAPDKLGIFLSRLHAIFDEKGIESAVYGHAGEGNLHTRPILDLRKKIDVDLMVELAEKVFKLVEELNGSISGEHGDGRVRTAFLPSFYGEAYNLLEETKRVFDPENILNPGIIARPAETKPVAQISMTDNLKKGPQYLRKKIPAPLGGSRNSLAEAIEKCHGCGNCTTPLDSIPMCPLFKATGLPQASPRGKMAIAQALLSGDFDREHENEEELVRYLSLCLGCGLCEIGCPSEVDTSQIVNQLRSVLKNRTGMPFKDKILSLLSKPLPTPLQPIAAAGSILNRNSAFRYLLERATSISTKAPLFQFSPFKLSSKCEKGKGRVIYFPDIYAISCSPELGSKCMELLKMSGYPVYTNNALVAATPGFAKGDEKSVRETVIEVRNILKTVVEPGATLLFSEPTAMRTLLKEHALMLADDESDFSQMLNTISTSVTNFLLNALEDGSLKKPPSSPPASETITYHCPCHLVGTKEEGSALRLLSAVGYKVLTVSKRCCGLAGTFGLQSGPSGYETSVKTGLKLFRDIKNTGAAFIACECSSCRLQLEENTGIRAIHPVELLYKLYDVK
jgi:FAD/FMN-containing dehydrogenase/Fe-S oxidoreductase